MRKSAEVQPGVIYCPYIPHTVATIVNGVVIWDERWWANLWYQLINRLSSRRRRVIKDFRESSSKKVDPQKFVA